MPLSGFALVGQMAAAIPALGMLSQQTFTARVVLLLGTRLVLL